MREAYLSSSSKELETTATISPLLICGGSMHQISSGTMARRHHLWEKRPRMHRMAAVFIGNLGFRWSVVSATFLEWRQDLIEEIVIRGQYFLSKSSRNLQRLMQWFFIFSSPQFRWNFMHLAIKSSLSCIIFAGVIQHPESQSVDVTEQRNPPLTRQPAFMLGEGRNPRGSCTCQNFCWVNRGADSSGWSEDFGVGNFEIWALQFRVKGGIPKIKSNFNLRSNLKLCHHLDDDSDLGDSLKQF